jgi:uncharacterized membrane protein
VLDLPALAGADPGERTIRRLEPAVSAVLLIGVTISSLVVAAGTALTLVARASSSSARRAVPELRRGVLHPGGLRSPHTIAAVISAIGHGEGAGLVMLGLLLLIATPVMRVAISVIGFALDHDRRFVLIALAVLAVLIGSFAVGA